MDYIYRVAARQLFNVEVAEGPLPMRALRNTDFQEVTLEVSGLFQAHAWAFGSRQDMICAFRGLVSMFVPLSGIGQTKEFCIRQPKPA